MSRNPFVILRSLPMTVRLMALGTLINAMGAMAGNYLTLVMVQKFGMPASRAAWIVGAFGFGTFLSVLLGGRLTDTLGRRKTLILSLFGSGVLGIVMGFITEIPVFVVTLFCLGFLFDLYRPASSAIIADMLPAPDRAPGFAAMRIAQNIGFATATALGGIVLDVNWRFLFWLDGGTTLVFAIIVLIGVHPPEKHHSGVSVAVERSAPVYRDPVFLRVVAAGFLMSLVYMTHFVVFPLTVTQAAGYSSRVVGYTLALNGIFVVLFELSIVKALSTKRRLRVTALGCGLIALGLGASGMLLHWAWFVATVFVWSIGEIISFSYWNAFTADWAPVDRRGEYMGFKQASWRISVAVCPLLFLPIYERVPVWAFWLIMPLLMVPTIAILLHTDRYYDRPENLRGQASLLA